MKQNNKYGITRGCEDIPFSFPPQHQENSRDLSTAWFQVQFQTDLNADENRKNEQEGHFVLTVKKNQPEAYEEIHTFMDKLEAEAAKKKRGEASDSVMRE